MHGTQANTQAASHFISRVHTFIIETYGIWDARALFFLDFMKLQKAFGFFYIGFIIQYVFKYLLNFKELIDSLVSYERICALCSLFSKKF